MEREKLQQLAEKIETMKNSICTEEATKTSMIMPFFQLMGYDVFNPLEFVPEYTADVGGKKKEKVDYAIMVEKKPLIFVECKSCNETLDKHCPQLIKYFNSTIEAKFAILTNGIIYNFYTDLDNSNVMDHAPFLSINLLHIKDRDINELSRFERDRLDVNTILSSAENLKYIRLVKTWMENETDNPSPDFVRLIISDMYQGVKSQKVVEQFTPIVKKAFTQYMNDCVNEKIQMALSKEPGNVEPEGNQNKEIETTLEEIEAYGIVKAILRKVVTSERITYRDTLSYFNIMLDDNNRKWICRVSLNNSKKYIVISDKDKNGVRYDIEKIDDIYNFANEIIESCRKYL